MTHRRLIGNTAALYVLQAVNYLFPMFVIPYLLHAIGVSGFGRIAFTGSVVQAFGIVIEFGFNYTASARIATSNEDPNQISEIFSAVITFKALLLILVSVLLVAVTILVPPLREDWPLIAAQWPMLAGELLFPLWLFQGLQKLGFVTLFHVLSRTVTLALLVTLVTAPDDVEVAAAIQASHYVIAGTVALIIARRHLGVRYRISALRAHRSLLRDTAQVFTGNIAGHVYVRGPMILVGMLGSEQLVGAFAVAQRIASLFTSAVSPLAQSLYPHLCTLAGSAPQRLRRLRWRTVPAIVIVLAIAVVCLNVLAAPLLAWLGESDPAVAAMLRIYSPVIVITGANVMLASFVLALRRYAEQRRTLLVGAAVFTAAALPATLWLDTYGMVLTVALVELVVFAQYIWTSSLRHSVLQTPEMAIVRDAGASSRDSASRTR